MMTKPMTISGAGCCLVDQIFPDIDFSRKEIQRCMSRNKGDGGLHPGRLVFAEQFESFTGQELQSFLKVISGSRSEPVLNVGGPSIVALIHAAQLLQGTGAEVRYFGLRGDDMAGDFLQEKLEQTPVSLDHFRVAAGATPSTIVLSDPSYNRGHGERMFINDIGASWNFGPEQLDNQFFDSDMVVFGGTALVPGLHDHLTSLLRRSREAGCITVVNTVYDFRNEITHPGKPWPLGHSRDSFRHMDLLLMDYEEAIHISGAEDIEGACTFFMDQGVSSFVITNGTENTWSYADGSLFRPIPLRSFPISRDLIHDLKDHRGGDTTGCGDNFVGGMLASLARQLQEGNGKPDLVEAITWGTVSGGYCCFHVGGTLLESEPGEKRKMIHPYYLRYKQQIHG